MNPMDQRVISLFFLLMALGVSAQLERPNARPYTLEGTYEKLRGQYPLVRPISTPGSEPITKEEGLTYHSVDGLDLKADVYYPEGKGKKFPGILLVHGGGWISGSKENLRPMAQHLAGKGFLAMTVNYRLADRAKYPAAVEDLHAATAFLKGSDLPIDRDRIAILGASAGAQLATLAGQQNTDIKAVVNVDGIVSFVHPEAKEGTYAAYWLGGTRSQRPELWKEASPLEHVHPESPPILFINSALPRFHAGRDDMIKKYREWGIYSEVHTHPDSPHSFWLVEPWFAPTLEHTVKFLQQVLQ